jgi:hypothetical protein
MRSNTYPRSSMVTKSTIVIFVIVFAILGLLLGFAESSDNTMNIATKVDENNTVQTKFSQYHIDLERLEIDPADSEFEDMEEKPSP